jgi:hypothetical protein
LEDRNYFAGEFCRCAGAVEDRGWLEAVKFVEFAVYTCVSDEVEDVVILGGRSLCFVDKG